MLGVERGEYSFGLPAGNIGPCEPVAEAASRELLEETGLHVNADELIEILDAVEPSAGRRVVTYYANDPGGSLAPQDQNVRAALWLGWPTLLEGKKSIIYDKDKQSKSRRRFA